MKPEYQLAKQFIAQYPLGVMATINDTGEPETAGVYCILDDDMNLYFLSASKTRKLNNIEKRPGLSITFMDEHGMKTMQVQGKGTVLATPVAAIEFEAVPQHIIDALLDIHVAKRDSWPTPAFKTGGGTQYFVKISPTWMRLADFGKATQSQAEIYTQVI